MGTPSRVVTAQSLYADGGCIQKNPSDIGGTFAWCLIEDDNLVQCASGVIVSSLTAIPNVGVGAWQVHGPVSNNVSEYIAAVLALKAMPAGWSGLFHSDSQITIGRLFWSWSLASIPTEWAIRGYHAVKRLGTVTPVLLQGHPTKADLERGIGAKRGFPVSKWNVWCDEQAAARGKEYLEKLNAARSEAVGVG